MLPFRCAKPRQQPCGSRQALGVPSTSAPSRSRSLASTRGSRTPSFDDFRDFFFFLKCQRNSGCKCPHSDFVILWRKKASFLAGQPFQNGPSCGPSPSFPVPSYHSPVLFIFRSTHLQRCYSKCSCQRENLPPVCRAAVRRRNLLVRPVAADVGKSGDSAC